MGFVGVYFIDRNWSSLYKLSVFKIFANKSFILMSHIWTRVMTKSSSGYNNELSLHLERSELQIISFTITGLNIIL